MGKKRAFDGKLKSNIEGQKSFPVEVISSDLSSNPVCLHGPTLLFSNEKGRFYACSLCRNRKDCPIYITEDEWQKEGVKKRNEKYNALMPKLNKNQLKDVLSEMKSTSVYNRAYCATCSEFFIIGKTKKHINDHKVVSPLTNDQLEKPTTWLPPLEEDTREAQYFFSKKSIAVILNTLKKNNINNVLCIGTPTIYEAATEYKFNAVLLDYDKRYASFIAPNKFLWYNMFNNYLFGGREDEKHLKTFIKNTGGSGISIVMDPPFGGRVEPLIQTIKELSETCRNVNKTFDSEMMPVIWAFPYFSEPYIKNAAPEIKMHDYQVEYENHSKFQNQTSNGRKFGSPVRLFTNLPLSSIDLSNDKKYRLCNRCKFWVSESNKHCGKCNECTSKNGMTYKHCNVCERCVKPTFFHCKTCERCCQEKSHVCGVIVESQSCFNCHDKGHKKAECPQLSEVTSKRKRKTA